MNGKDITKIPFTFSPEILFTSRTSDVLMVFSHLLSLPVAALQPTRMSDTLSFYHCFSGTAHLEGYDGTSVAGACL